MYFREMINILYFLTWTKLFRGRKTYTPLHI